MINTKTLDNILIIFSALIIIGFCVYLYLNIRKLRKRSTVADKLKKQAYSKCPNFFKICGKNDIDKDCRGFGDGACVNQFKIGKCKNTYNFDYLIKEHKNLFYNKNLQNRMKCRWAKDCNIAWDGIDRLC